MRMTTQQSGNGDRVLVGRGRRRVAKGRSAIAAAVRSPAFSRRAMAVVAVGAATLAARHAWAANTIESFNVSVGGVGYYDVAKNYQLSTGGVGVTPTSTYDVYIDGGRVAQAGGDGVTSFAAGNLFVGNGSVGTFQQSLGTFVDSYSLNLGNTSTGTGNVYLSGTAVFNSANAVSIGANSANANTMNISGSASLNVSAGGLNVGYQTSSAGILNILGGTIGVNSLLAGRNGTATGYVFQTGGSVATTGSVSLGGNATTATQSVGIYNFGGAGSTFTSGGAMNVGFYGTGLWSQTAGTANVSSGNAVLIGGNAGAYGVFDLSGGVFNEVGTGNLFKVAAVSATTGYLNVRGSGVLNVASTSKTAALQITTTSGTGVVNLLTGGTINTASVGIGTAGGNSIFDFNGGTLATTANNATGGFTLMGGLTSAYVYPGGAIFDTTQGSGLVTQTLSAPGGNGITSIAVNGTPSGYVAAPVVKITDSGSGTGATAVATLTNGVLSIQVLNPGTGYTNPTVTLVGGQLGQTGTAATATATVMATSPLFSAGNLIKNGINTLTLSPTAANNYAGTVINAGAIATGTAFALPSGTPLTLNNTGSAINFSGAYAEPFGSTTPGLTLSTLTAGSGEGFGFNASSTGGIDFINFSSGASVAGGELVTINAPTGNYTLTAGNYDLITAPGGLGGSGAFSLTNNSVTANGLTYSLSLQQSTDSAIVLTVGVGAVAKLYYTGTTSSDLNNAGAYTTDIGGGSPSMNVPSASTDLFFTATSNVSNYAPTTSSAVFANSLEFNSPTAVTITGTGTITLSAGKNTFLAGNGIIVDASATAGATIAAPLAIATSQTFTNNETSAPLVLSGGVALGGNTLTLTGPGGFTVNGGLSGTGSVIYNSNVSTGISVGGASSYVGTTTITGTGAGNFTTVKLLPGSTSPLGAATNTLILSGGNADPGTIDLNGQQFTQGTLNISGGRVTDSNTASPGLLTLNASNGVDLITTAGFSPSNAPTGMANLALGAPGTTNYVIRNVTVTSNNGPALNGSLGLNGTNTAFILGTGTSNAATKATPDMTVNGQVTGSSLLTLDNTNTSSGVTLALAPNDGGTLLLTNSNTYTGGTDIHYGRLVIANSNALGRGLVTIDGTPGSSGGTLQLYDAAFNSSSPNSIGDGGLSTGGTPAALIVTNNISLAGATGGTFSAGIINNLGSNTLSGNVTLAASIEAINVSTGSTLTLSGNIANADGIANTQLTTTGSTGSFGTLVLSGSNTYVGSTSVGIGATVKVGSVTALGNASNGLVVAGNNQFGKLDLNGFSVTQGSLNLSQGEVIDSSPTGTGLLKLSSTGAAIVVASAANYSVTANNPAVSANIELTGSTSYIVKTATGANIGPVISGRIQLDGATTIALADTSGDANPELAMTGVISGSGSLTLANNTASSGVTLPAISDFATLFLGGASANTYMGGTNINFGRVVIASSNALGAASSPVTIGGSTGNSGGTLQLGNPNYGSSSDVSSLGVNTSSGLNLPYAISLAGATSGNYSAGIINAVGTNAFSGPITLTQANAVVQVNTGTTLFFNGSIGQTAGATNGLTLTGNSKTAGGTLILTSASTYTGATNISSATVFQLGTGVAGQDGTIANTSGVLDNGTLAFNRFGTANSAGYVISGTGGVTMAGPGKQALTAANTYAGGTTVTSGTLLVSNATGSGTGTFTVTVNGGVLGGTGTMTGNVVLSSAGTITAGTGGTPGDSTGVLTSSSTHTWTAGSTYTVKIDASNASSGVAVGSGASGIPGVASDELVFSGLTSSTGININPVFITATAGALTSGQYSFIIADDKTGAATSTPGVGSGVFDGLTLGTQITVGTSSAGTFGLSTASDGTAMGEVLILDFNSTAAAPEPTSLLLAGIAAAPLVLGRRRRAGQFARAC